MCLFLTGCHDPSAPAGKLELVWGRRGLGAGRFQTPRALAIDKDDLLYIVDKTARIQVFTPDGEYVRGWRTPAFENGKPCGLVFDRDGNLVVADTHYFRVLFYTPEGKLLEERTIGGESGQGPGQFGFLTDVVQDSKGNYYVGEYGEYDRIQKFSPTGEYLLQWGGHGREPGKFIRPQGITIDQQDHLWIADACNHRIQVFDEQGTLLQYWGEHGREPGQLGDARILEGDTVDMMRTDQLPEDAPGVFGGSQRFGYGFAIVGSDIPTFMRLRPPGLQHAHQPKRCPTLRSAPGPSQRTF